MAKFRSCRRYCGHLGSACLGAWDDHRDSCRVTKAATCGYNFRQTSDAICECSPGNT